MRGRAATSDLQRRLRIGYGRAGNLIDQMAKLGYISNLEGNKPRTVFMTVEQFKEQYGDEE
jgi:S-DNA-T family DNA segregation ATPase FtsK/SpoIIIE